MGHTDFAGLFTSLGAQPHTRHCRAQSWLSWNPIADHPRFHGAHGLHHQHTAAGMMAALSLPSNHSIFLLLKSGNQFPFYQSLLLPSEHCWMARGYRYFKISPSVTAFGSHMLTPDCSGNEKAAAMFSHESSCFTWSRYGLKRLISQILQFALSAWQHLSQIEQRYQEIPTASENSHILGVIHQ